MLYQLKGHPHCNIDVKDLYQVCLSLVTGVPCREKSVKVLKTQETKDEDRETVKLKDVPDSSSSVAEDRFQQRLMTQKIKSKTLKETADEFCKMRRGRSRPNTGYLPQGWFQAAVKTMATNANNGIAQNFTKRLRSYVLDTFEVTKSVGHEIVNGMLAQMFDSVPVELKGLVIAELREKILLTKEGEIS
ncbi:hypothetical protein P3T76_011222 [Phytophthora citrophthora]|uniref:Uncharacterized protein n=1 Tax=Phytophthora citrophthora TaxID=4793 RepID=A0AAD9LFE1_9STRA|nr:hypothetical protein P3T76_011222 [Phytophthora citrophthora]